MARQNYLFTSRIGFGGPSRQGLRPHLRRDRRPGLPRSQEDRHGPWQVRIACETLATTNRVVIAGEVRVPETLLKKDKDGKILKDAAGRP